jgi:hypothetical protein
MSNCFYKYKYFFVILKLFIKKMDLEEIIYILKRYTIPNRKEEMGEQEDAASTSSTSSAGGGYPTVTKWETGLTRSVANQIDYKAKWKDLNKLTRGKANTLL